MNRRIAFDQVVIKCSNGDESLVFLIFSWF